MAMATSYARQGERTLLAELGEYSYYQMALGHKSSFSPLGISENLSLSLWNGESCLRDYVRHLIPIRPVADLFFDNRVMRSFVRAAPGLKELAVLGKLTSGIRNWGPPFDFDRIVVDAYASGHLRALLNAPKGFGEIIESGPMGEQSRAIVNVISNPDLISYHIVTLPEELPTLETIELKDQILDLTGIESKIWLNKAYELGSPVDAPEKDGFLDYVCTLSRRTQWSREKLSAIARVYNEIGFVREVGAGQVIESLSQQISGRLT